MMMALPPDVRKGFAFPLVAPYKISARLRLDDAEAQPPRVSTRVDGKAEPFRTSGGGAGAV